MPATANRLTLDDLAKMEARTHVRLTAEGAQSWYVIDVQALLAEVVASWAELEDAQNSLAADMPRAETRNLPIPKLTEMWKARATGFWEKRQVKLLQTEQRELTAERDSLNIELDAAKTHLAAGNEHIEQLRQALDAGKDQLAQSLAEHQQALAATHTEIQSLRSEVDTLNEALVESQERSTQSLRMSEALNAERRTLASELLREVLVLIGDQPDAAPQAT